MNIYYWKKVKLNIPRFWHETVKVYIIPIIMCVVTLLTYTFIDFYNIYFLVTGIVIYTIIYCLLSWFVMMNDYEKDIFRSPINKILNKIRKKKETV